MTAQRRLSRCKDQNNADEPTSNGPSGFPANGLSGAVDFATRKGVLRRHALCNEKAVGRLALWTVPICHGHMGRCAIVAPRPKPYSYKKHQESRVCVYFWVDLLDKCSQFQIMRETIACFCLCFFLWGTFQSRSQAIASRRCGSF